MERRALQQERLLRDEDSLAERLVFASQEQRELPAPRAWPQRAPQARGPQDARQRARGPWAQVHRASLEHQQRAQEPRALRPAERRALPA